MNNIWNTSEFEIINVLNNAGILDEALLNDDGLWGETIEDWENHFELLVQGNCFDDDEIDEKTMKLNTAIQFIIRHIVDNKVNIETASCKGLYQEYIQWCNDNEKEPVNQQMFGCSSTKIGIGRKRTAKTRYYKINRAQIIKKLIDII